MKEYTLIIDDPSYYDDHFDLFEYLLTLNGIEDVVIVDGPYLTSVTVKYNEKLIGDNQIRYEIMAFSELLNYPCIHGFDKHSSDKDIVTVKIDYHTCCEYCFANNIYTLVDTPGIVKVETDFYENYWKKCIENYSMTISYDPKIISKEKFEKLKKEIEC